MADDDQTPERPFVDFSGWAPVLGRWETHPDGAVYTGPEDPTEPAVGMLIAPDSVGVMAGVISVHMRFPSDPQEQEPQGRLVFGFTPRAGQHYSAGLGGYRALYCVEAFLPSEGYVSLSTLGRADALQRDRDYDVTVTLLGQRAILDVDGVAIADVSLPSPLEGSQVGLTARGRSTVEFHSFLSLGEQPEAFIVMKFGEPYDTLYREVIAPVCAELGYQPVRADEFSGPGVIIEDIIDGIRRASVVIAEITPVNANVFYELGYAHATGKPTILLADRGELENLPFDVSGRRTIFYDDSIGGKPRVEADLRRHLLALS
jgi:hypothetical protein